MQGLWRGLGFSAKHEEARSWRMGKEAYEKKMIHHEGIKQLWESKWKFPVRLSPSSKVKAEEGRKSS